LNLKTITKSNCGVTKPGFAKTGLQFCGLMMGDHSKCGINTMFNTGTVVGVSANILVVDFNFVPSFSGELVLRLTSKKSF
jgi:hypothetical protein